MSNVQQGISILEGKTVKIYMVNKKSFNLENRLIEFSLKVIEIVEQLPNTRAGNHIANQLIRSGTSPALNYGEAQGAESKNDFIHKMKICLKELRETLICLKIIYKKPFVKNSNEFELLLKENDELVAIFVKSITTAQSKK
jgi:four helix bundle protein